MNPSQNSFGSLTCSPFRTYPLGWLRISTFSATEHLQWYFVTKIRCIFVRVIFGRIDESLTKYLSISVQWWLGVLSQQAIAWTNVDQRHMAWLGHNGLRDVVKHFERNITNMTSVTMNSVLWLFMAWCLFGSRASEAENMHFHSPLQQ